jgi:hypothetical protein
MVTVQGEVLKRGRRAKGRTIHRAVFPHPYSSSTDANLRLCYTLDCSGAAMPHRHVSVPILCTRFFPFPYLPYRLFYLTDLDFLNFVDRSNLSNARLGSLEADLGMKGTDFNLGMGSSLSSQSVLCLLPHQAEPTCLYFGVVYISDEHPLCWLHSFPAAFQPASRSSNFPQFPFLSSILLSPSYSNRYSMHSLSPNRPESAPPSSSPSSWACGGSFPSSPLSRRSETQPPSPAFSLFGFNAYQVGSTSQTFTHLLVIRFFLGVVEAPFFPLGRSILLTELVPHTDVRILDVCVVEQCSS